MGGFYIKRTVRKGFTLIEILLVVVLLGIIAGAAFPSLGKSYTMMRLQVEANDLSYAMRYAQGKAIAEKRKHRLEFNSDFSKYFILEDSGNDVEFEGDEDSSYVDGEYRRFSGRRGRTFKIAEDITVDAAKQSVEFYPDGSIEKIQVNLCYGKKCLVVSTQEHRGRVQVLKLSSP